jgi:hypothetical protein
MEDEIIIYTVADRDGNELPTQYLDHDDAVLIALADEGRVIATHYRSNRTEYLEDFSSDESSSTEDFDTRAELNGER